MAKTPPTKPTAPVMDQRMTELLGRIHELDDAELTELADLIMQAFDQAQSDPAKVQDEASLQNMEALAAAATDVNKERKRRAALGSRRERAESVLAALVPEDRRPPLWRTHTRSGGATARVVTASGHELTDGDGASVAREFLDAIRRMPAGRVRSSEDGMKVPVVTLHADRPDDRTLRTSDSAEAVTASLAMAAEEHQRTALTAAGGLGAPEDSDYTLPGFESAERPVKAALPTFTATRGGIRFIKPPTLADLAGALGIWTVANDIAAATNTAIRKPALRVTPTNEVIVDVQAVTNTLIFGNMIGRAYPEFVERTVALALGAHARIAEQQLLTQIGALSTAVTGSAAPIEGGNLGATRVLLPLLDRAATGMRDRLRAGASVPLQLILPHWARGILRTDLAIQEPGDATLGVTDTDLASYLASRFLTVTWALDGEAGQQFSVQNPGAVNAWPTSVRAYMFPAGAMQFLDGGMLDLGLVRDSTLNAANDYIMFSETFESVAFRGGESLRITQAVTPNGIARAAAA